jgi:hypothetical protein
VNWTAVASVGSFPFSLIETQAATRKQNEFTSSGLSLVLMIASPFIIFAFQLIWLAFSTGIYHLAAKVFRGTGTYRQLFYCLGAVYTPLLVVLAIGSSFSTLVPISSCFTSLFGLVLAVYIHVLVVNAIRAVERLGGMKAVITLFLPSIIAGAILIFAIVAITASLSAMPS